MIRSNVVTGVMSFAEMDAMMYKIEGEDLYLIGTSEPVSYTHLTLFERSEFVIIMDASSRQIIT